MILTCILNDCPATKQMVDWRKCEHCKWRVDDEHRGPQIKCANSAAMRINNTERWQAMRDAVGCLHVRMVTFDQKGG